MFIEKLTIIMKTTNIVFAGILMLGICAVRQTLGQVPDAQTRMEWWREARFGMFIHWGVYAVPAGVYNGHKINRIGEWIMNRGKISVQSYRGFASQFNPINYNPDAWVKMAKDAGMKYIVITTKHHDGFALFDSKVTDWDMVDATPYGKDLIKPLAAACRKHGVRLGFYYSQAQDWVHPGGAVARKVASEGWLNPDSARIDAYTAMHEGHWDSLQTTRSMESYINSIAVPQVKELLTNYGDVAILWWDTPTRMTDEFASRFASLLTLQPEMITNDRLKRPNYPGDFKTPEQRIPNLSELDGKDWETCMTMNETWGYKQYANNWKSTATLIRNLIDVASKGGNYLLNVGPKADGTFPEESVERLSKIGEWMAKNSDAIYGTKGSPLEPFEWGRCTYKKENNKTILYISVFDWPTNRTLAIPGIENDVLNVHILSTGEELASSRSDDVLTVKVPERGPDPIVTVVAVELNGELSRSK
jgi:alpha-L-fucosidase